MKNGRVVAIFISPIAGGLMHGVQEVEAIYGAGLLGDRYSTGQGSFNKKIGIGNRQVTLISSQFFEDSSFEYYQSRRNIITTDIELMRCINKEFRIASVYMRGVKYCEPCNRPSELIGKSASFEHAFSDRCKMIGGNFLLINLR